MLMPAVATIDSEFESGGKLKHQQHSNPTSNYSAGHGFAPLRFRL